MNNASAWKRRCSRANGSIQKKLSSQHKQIIPVSFFFFIISPDTAHQIPPAGLRHRDPGEWSGLSTILFSRFHINKVFCSRRGLQKNHNAAEFSHVLFKTNRILTGSFLGPLITPEACTPPSLSEWSDDGGDYGWVLPSRECPRWAPNARWKDYADPYMWCCGCVPPVGLNPICSRFGLEGASKRRRVGGGWSAAVFSLHSTFHLLYITEGCG